MVLWCSSSGGDKTRRRSQYTPPTLALRASAYPSLPFDAAKVTGCADARRAHADLFWFRLRKFDEFTYRARRHVVVHSERSVREHDAPQQVSGGTRALRDDDAHRPRRVIDRLRCVPARAAQNRQYPQAFHVVSSSGSGTLYIFG